MARVVSIIDDITGEAGASKRDFAVGPDAFTIDLTDEGWEEFQAAVAPWVERGTRTGPNRNIDKVKTAARASATPINESARRHSPEESAACREWAIQQGIPMRADGGRIAADIWRGFYAKDRSLVKPERWKTKEQGSGQGSVDERQQLELDRAS